MASTFTSAKYILVKSNEGAMCMLCAENTLAEAQTVMENDYAKELSANGLTEEMAEDEDVGGFFEDGHGCWLYKRENLDWRIFKVNF